MSLPSKRSKVAGQRTTQLPVITSLLTLKFIDYHLFLKSTNEADLNIKIEAEWKGKKITLLDMAA